MSERLKRKLVLEVELPTLYVDDIPEAIEEFGGPDADVSEEILRDIGEVWSGLLVVRVIGEKDSVLQTVPLLVRSARIEDAPPPDRAEWGDGVDYLADECEELECHLPSLFLDRSGDAR